jgi:anti-sigma factor RsiW
MRHLGERLSALIDGELSGGQRERVLSHLARCESCRDEATALRLLKRRMTALGEAAAGDEPNWRLLALAATDAQPAPWPRRVRSARLARPAGLARPVLVAGGVAVAAASIGLSAAAFVAGGSQPPAGPRVVPALDVFMVQHAITTGDVPVQPLPSAPVSPVMTPGAP